jgi:hypothetical protein
MNIDAQFKECERIRESIKKCNQQLETVRNNYIELCDITNNHIKMPVRIISEPHMSKLLEEQKDIMTNIEKSIKNIPKTGELQ